MKWLNWMIPRSLIGRMLTVMVLVKMAVLLAQVRAVELECEL